MEPVCAVSIGTISLPLSFYRIFPVNWRPHYRSLDKGKLQDLIAVEKLRQPQYNITAQDMIQSSVEAYLAHGLSYTAEEMTPGLQISATLPSDQQWFAKGAAGEGAFTIPVCDVGMNTEWMGKGMPCCCGKLSLFYSFRPSSAWNVSVDLDFGARHRMRWHKILYGEREHG